jgi:hypothetical protein
MAHVGIFPEGEGEKQSKENNNNVKTCFIATGNLPCLLQREGKMRIEGSLFTGRKNLEFRTQKFQILKIYFSVENNTFANCII